MSKTYTVTTPNKNFNGMREGVIFTDGTGKAKTEEQVRNLINIYGYSCPDYKGKGTKKDESKDNLTGSQAIENWRDAVSAVKALETAEEIDPFIEGDDRASVIKAAEDRKEELQTAK